MFSCATVASGFTLPETNWYHIQGLRREDDRFLFPLVGGICYKVGPYYQNVQDTKLWTPDQTLGFPSFLSDPNLLFGGDPKSQVRRFDDWKLPNLQVPNWPNANNRPNQGTIEVDIATSVVKVPNHHGPWGLRQKISKWATHKTNLQHPPSNPGCLI